MFNNLFIKLECPNCKCESVMKVQFYIGELWLYDYVLGDKIKWKVENKPGNGIPRPLFGNDLGQGYCNCEKCRFDFWVDIVVENDTITNVFIRKDEVNYLASKWPKYE